MDDTLLTWETLAKIIERMPEAMRSEPVICQSDETGEFYGFTSVGHTDSEDPIPDRPILESDNYPLIMRDGKYVRGDD